VRAPLTVDSNEPREIPDRLVELGVEVERRKIAPGDYVCGEVGIERKSLHDFVSSLIKKRLFEQLRRLREAYPVALMILEGDLAEVSEFASPQALLGALVAIEVDERVPVLTTADREQTVVLLKVIWSRQDRERGAYGLRHKPKTLTLEARQRFLVEGLPNVGDTLARNLLERFGSVRAVFDADPSALRQVPKIGEGRAAEIARVLTAKYEGRQRRVDEEPADD
jgi:ERCC4-type nuclease